MRKQKEYKCTSKIKYAYIKYVSRDRLADKYIEADKHDRAAKTVEEAEKLRVKMWDMVYELHPKLKDVKAQYLLVENIVREVL